ncbi:hypothetical protein GOBAR_DD23027 [Gossypium barbadense]|nr:hypothetical protein GOBAR_DD23027 [Gossypium barbadense]
MSTRSHLLDDLSTTTSIVAGWEAGSYRAWCSLALAVQAGCEGIDSEMPDTACTELPSSLIKDLKENEGIW